MQPVNGLVGHGALLLALPFTILGIIAVPVAVKRGRRDWLDLAYGSVYANFALMTAAALAMISALVTHDFSVSYVAQVGSRETPLFYTIISLWGALEGSILFWASVRCCREKRSTTIGSRSRARGRWRRGAFSRPRSSRECGGRTRCSAGAAIGRGIRSRTRRSFPGSRRRRSCTRRWFRSGAGCC